jgi:hypothetical protein
MNAHTLRHRRHSRVDLLRAFAVLTVLALLALGAVLLQEPEVGNVNAKSATSATITRKPANGAALAIDRDEPAIEYSGMQGHYRDESTEPPPTF